MFKKIISTFGTRLLNALCGFVTLWLGTNKLGAEAWGISGVVLLDITFILLAVEVLAGSSLVYFTPKKKTATLFVISIIWSLLVIAATYGLFQILAHFPKIYHDIVPEGYETAILILTFLYSILNFNNNVLLGKERIKAFNLLFILQFVTQLTTMLVLIYGFNITNANAFVGSLFAGYIISALAGLICVAPYVMKEGIDDLRSTFKEMFGYGITIQLSSMVHILNKRLSLYIIKRFGGYNNVGIYNSGAQVGEAVKLIGHSLSLVQFSLISNSNDNNYAAQLTLQFLKITIFLTTLSLTVLALIPTSVYEWVFSKEFGEIKQILLAMMPGIIFMASNNILSHYFSGCGRPKYNLYASLIGLAVTITSSLILIPSMGYIGAGISLSITFLFIAAFQWIVFKKSTTINNKDLLITKKDMQVLLQIIKQLKHSKLDK